MKISLATHGGQAAAINMRRPPRVLDVDSLPKPQAAELAQLVDAAKKAPPAKAGPGSGGDAMSYTVTVEGDGEPVTLQQSDTAMSAAFSDLLDKLQRHLASK
jgi:hypothetical protein